MRSLLLLPLAAVAFLVGSAFSNFKGSVKTIGVYDRDSVLARMPEFKQALDSVELYRMQMNKKLFEIDSTLRIKKIEFVLDSADMTASEKMQKQKEISGLEDQSADYEDQLDFNTETMRRLLLDEVETKINNTASELAKKKKYAAVLNKMELEALFPDKSEIRIISVTGAMIQGVTAVPKK